MGGYGSGRWGWHNRKRTVDESLTLDGYSLLHKGFNEMKRLSSPATFGSLIWSVGDREVASIAYGLVRSDDRVTLTLRYSAGDTPIVEEIPLQSTEQPQGGVSRYWLTCPFCRRRTAKLHMPGGQKRFGCRQCYRLTYRSCQEAHQFDAMFRSLAADMPVPCDWRDVRDLLNEALADNPRPRRRSRRRR